MKNKAFKIKNLIRVTLVLSLLIITSVSCKEEKPSDTEEIRQKISEYNQQIVELNQKVSALEKDLEALGETTQNRERTPVIVEELEYQPFEHYVKVNAVVEAVNEATISPEVNGHITDIYVSKGQNVRAGQTLARLNTSVIENNIAEVKTQMQLAETVYNRQKRLWDQEIGSEMQFLEAKNNYESLQTRLKTLQSQLNMAVIHSPINGLVDDIFVKEGELAMPGARLMQVISLDQLYINADISETLLPVVEPSDQVTLRFPVFPEFEQKVPIHRLGNVINPENRTFRLQLKIDNQNKKFKPNMVASLSIPSYQTDQALVVPSIMIKQDVQGYYIFLAEENQDGDLVANKVYIERGLSGEGNTMITSGINPGDLFITRGHNRVADGSLIKITESRALADSIQ